jgi:DNA N-6-adenine-methyltransferase (Dam)
MTAGRQSITETKDWCTPPHIVESVRRVFGGSIDLDPCSNEDSVVEARVSYLLPEEDGLAASWDYGTIYVNPPYGTDKERGTRIAHWFVRIAEAARNGSQVIALVPVATNTGHWKRFVYPVADAICFLYEPRVKFYIGGREDSKGAPMSCAVIYYGDDPSEFAAEFRTHGAVLPLDSVTLPHAGAWSERGQPALPGMGFSRQLSRAA